MEGVAAGSYDPGMARGRGTGSLRPVQDVVSTGIRFDAALDAARFRVGYEERGAGIRSRRCPCSSPAVTCRGTASGT